MSKSRGEGDFPNKKPLIQKESPASVMAEAEQGLGCGLASGLSTMMGKILSIITTRKRY